MNNRISIHARMPESLKIDDHMAFISNGIDSTNQIIFSFGSLHTTDAADEDSSSSSSASASASPSRYSPHSGADTYYDLVTTFISYGRTMQSILDTLPSNALHSLSFPLTRDLNEPISLTNPSESDLQDHTVINDIIY